MFIYIINEHTFINTILYYLHSPNIHQQENNKNKNNAKQYSNELFNKYKNSSEYIMYARVSICWSYNEDQDIRIQ